MHHVLLIANRTCPWPTVLDTVREHADGGSVHVVAPALNSRLRHWVSDTDEAVHRAEERLAAATAALRDHGLAATATIGDSDPLVAIEDALYDFPADEIVIATHPTGESNWLERDLPDRAEMRFRLPVTHLISEHEREPVA